MISCTLVIEPQVKQRPRVVGRIAYTPARTRAFEKQCAILAKSYMRGRLPLEGPLRVTLGFWFKRPAKPSHGYPTKGDLDNFIKCIDAFNGVFWEDDAQIVQIVATKTFAPKGEPGRIVVEVGEVIV